MTRLNLDDLPPKLAALMAGVGAGEEVLLVRGGTVVGRLIGAVTPSLASEAEPPPPEEHAQEIFEQFRSAIEEEF